MSARLIARATRVVATTLAIFIVLVLPALLAVPSQGQPVEPGTWFEYDFNTYTDQGAGDYEGYWDEMKSHSRYTITGVIGDEVTMRALGSWDFRASDGTEYGDALDLTFRFNLTSRRYIGPYDVDGVYTDPSIWFWVPVPLTLGGEVRILDDVLEVRALDNPIWFGLVPRSAALLESTGSYARDDAYGQFNAQYRDRYWFDRETGFVVAELYEERDVAFAPYAEFRWRAEVFVRSSSYAIPLHLPLFVSLDVGIPALLIASAILYYRRRRGPWRVSVDTGQGRRRIKIRRIRNAKVLEGLELGGSRFFAPFLPIFARRALASKDPTVLATDGERIAGLFTHDTESNVGSLFAEDVEVVRSLAKRLPVKDFFAEGERVAVPARAVDTFLVLELRSPQPIPYDTELVRPMDDTDLEEITAIAEGVYESAAKQWIRSCIRDGDLGFVAVHGKIVGFGLATVADGTARLHSLTVLAPFRARGFGSEIMAARLSSLAALGVDRVLVEISTHNAASLRVAYKFGFREVGRTTYFSRSPGRAAFPWQRRF